MIRDKRILVVDDDLAIRRLARIVLTRSGCKVEEARNGFEAISAMNERRYDAVLLDLMMPNCSGFEVIRFFEDSGLNRPCFVIMSAASDREVARVTSDLVHSILRKPFDIDELVSAIAKCLVAQPRRSGSDAIAQIHHHSN